MSVVLHGLLAAGFLLLVRARPVDPGATPTGTVELLMVEKRGSGQPTPPSPPDTKAAPAPAPPVPAPPSPPSPPAPAPVPPSPAANPVPPTPPAAVPPAPQPSDSAGKPVPPASQAAPQPAKPDATPAPPAPAPPQQTAIKKPTPKVAPPPPAEAPVFNLEGTDSDSNAIAMGQRVLPASPDDRYRNRPPVYPYDAAVRGEHGTVDVMIHVSEAGAWTGADVTVTSGVASLDRAALDAVRKWHFRPAMKDGRTVPFDMPMRFIFDVE